MRKRVLSCLAVTVVFLMSCSLTELISPVPTAIATPTETAAPIPTLTPTLTPTPDLTMVDTIEEAADLIITALAEEDLETVAAFVHPILGVRFTPYAYLMEEQLVFNPEELSVLMESEVVYTWGSYDGTGDPIELTFREYYNEFIYSADFLNPDEIGVNERIGQGNSLDNIAEFYENPTYVEYYLSGTEEYAGMDWQSLRLVFTLEDGRWFLIGIVHDQWTI